ncbi:MAG TPA: glycosyltransferase [Solirubrobacteraceae bacterium]|jgi:cellulose synthase/poly-beta-1,6-N-acetylglucosamine synthase-like glycosyltransferase
MATALEIVFWVAAGLVLWTQVGYFLALAAAARVRRRLRTEPAQSLNDPYPTPSPSPSPSLPSVSLVIAAHNEQSVIAEKLGNALALDYPEELLEIVVACDGCSDRTAERARAAGASTVLELPRGGKIRAQDAAVERSQAEIVAFSDANSLWEPAALRTLIGAFADPAIGYACGEVSFRQAASGHAATNQEGAYWRYEMALRKLESELCSITAGNGAIYAVRRSDYVVVDPVMGHDLSLPFNMVKRARRAVYVPAAKAAEKMVPSIEGEQARKRRMMAHTWAIVFRGGMLSPAGYGPLYLTMIVSHRLLRYLTPFLHLIALAANVALIAVGAGSLQALYIATLALQGAVLLAALAGRSLRWRGLLLARYYVLNTAALATGLWDWLRHGVAASWEAAEGTR